MDTEALKRSLITKFQEVCADRLQKIQLGVLELEKPERAQAADEIARELHTMKGEARMLGLAAVGQIAHASEDLLKVALEGKTPIETATDLLLRACDALSDLLDDVESAREGNGDSEAMCLAMAKASGSAVPQLHPSRSGGGGGTSGAPRQRATKPAEATPRTSPPAGAVKTPAAPSGSDPAAPSTAGQRPEVRTGRASPATTSSGIDASEAGTRRTAPADRTIRVNVELLDSLGLTVGDLLVESARSRLRGSELVELLDRFTRLSDRLVKTIEAVEGPVTADGHLERLAGDLDLLRDDAFRFVRKHEDGMDVLQGSLTLAADLVADARLVPLSTVFEAFPRAVRDIARQQGKQVQLTVENSGAGVDRSMIADVRDALVHLVRNAIDHGLEGPEERLTLGKPEKGSVLIRARSEGEMLHVQVQDDGRGIDPARLRTSAVEKGLLTRTQADSLSEREATELIFRPGFSTRAEVTDLSGRGVGMDVVRRKVESLGGAVSIQSRLGRGTTFGLRLPQSLALMRVLLIRLGDDVYGFPAADVEAVLRIRPEERMEVFGTLTVNHRGQPVALVALGPLLALNGGNRFERPPAVIVRHGDDLAALVVDGFIDEREVAVKPCGGDFLNGAPFVAGTASLEDGRVAVLLHLPDIMAEVRRMARPVSEASASTRLRVLLVDDSPIARATESALVKALGHIVEEAQDGEEALERLDGHSYDLVLTDVQMPRMDGITLTRRIKDDPRLRHLPVVILSSLATPEDKRRGLDAGADAYLIKGELGVEVMAQTLERLA